VCPANAGFVAAGSAAYTIGLGWADRM